MGLLDGLLNPTNWFRSTAIKPDATNDATKIMGLNSAEQANLAINGQGTINGAYVNANPSQLPAGDTVQNILGHNATNPFASLDPNGNDKLQNAAQFATKALNGDLQGRVGGDAANAANLEAQKAAQRIGVAGTDTRGQALQSADSAAGQNAQSASDLNMVRNSANGTGPSAAAELAKSQLDNNIRAQAAMAATARGGNVASAMRGAQESGTQQMLQSQSQMAAQRAQEQLNAQQTLTQGNAQLGGNMNNTAGLYANQRGQDVAQAGAVASGLGDVAKTAAANFGTGASLAGQGLSGLNTAAGLQQSSAAQQQIAQQNAKQMYADFLQKQMSIGAGLPVSFAGPQAQIQIANQQTSNQQQGAALSAIAALAA